METSTVHRYGKATIWMLIVTVALGGVVAPLILTEEVYSTLVSYVSERYYQQELNLNTSPIANWSHRILGITLLVVGMAQFNEKLRRNHRTLHRWLGRLYLTLGTIVALTGTVLALRHAFAGVAEQFAIVMIDILLAFFLWRGFMFARRREFRSHRECMIRAFSVLLFITVFRPYFVVSVLLFDLREPLLFLVAGFLSLSTTILIGELWIRHTRALLGHGA